MRIKPPPNPLIEGGGIKKGGDIGGFKKGGDMEGKI